MTPPRRAVLAAGLLILPLLAQPGSAAAPTVRLVRMARMRFGPVPSGLRVGDIIEWVNDDIVRHTATARNGAFDVDLKRGARARTALRTPGLIDVYCRYHPGMTGRLEVEA